MKTTRRSLLAVILLLNTAFISSIISEDDPFAGMDMGGSADGSVTAPADSAAGGGASMDAEMAAYMESEASGGTVAAPAEGAPQVTADNSGVPEDAGGSADMAASADVLFPDDAAGGAPVPGMEGSAEGIPGEAAGGDLPGMGGEMGMPEEGSVTGIGQAPQQAAPEAKPAEASKPAAKKSGPSTDKGVTKTNDIYTKSSYIGGFRHLREIMDWGIKATSKLSPENDASKLGDNIVDTAWIEGKKDGGKKQVITFSFDEKYFIGLYEKKYQKVKISKIMVLNGNAAGKAAWKKYFRARKVKITQNKKLKFYMILRDTMNWQTITLKKPLIVKPGDMVRAEIMDAYPEVRREDDTYVAITEFTFLGEPYGGIVEPKYVPNSLDGSK